MICIKSLSITAKQKSRGLLPTACDYPVKQNDNQQAIGISAALRAAAKIARPAYAVVMIVIGCLYHTGAGTSMVFAAITLP
jgi:hypothetical protein